MERIICLTLAAFVLACLAQTPPVHAKETVLSTVLTPDTKEKTLNRQGRSYYDQRYGARPLYERQEYARPEYDRPSRCGRCYEDDSDYDRPSRDRYDDDRRVTHRPTYGNRHDNKNKNYDNDNDQDDRRYDNDRKKNNNGTEDDTEDGDSKKRPYDDKDSRPSGSRRGGDRDRNRHDDRDRYRPDYYDKFLQRDPYRERGYDRPYEDPYRERRPVYDRYDEGYGGRYDAGAYPGHRRPVYDDRYGRGGGYDDIYGGYGPGAGRRAHDSFRPWDETYRGQAGWDAGGRGYYFASGRPEAAPASAWGARPEYARPEQSAGGWQNVGYASAGGYRDPLEYRGSIGYGQDTGYRQDLSTGYGQASGWHSVGERRPYRDQSGVNQLDNRESYRQPARTPDDRYGQSARQPGAYGQNNYGQQNTYQSTGASGYATSSTTPQTSYLYQRENEQVTTKADEVTTKPPS